jgi:hypothetical protein
VNPRGLCVGHYHLWLKEGPLRPLGVRCARKNFVCTFPDCDRRAIAFRLCRGHRRQAKRGEDLRPLHVHAPAGAGSLDHNGYRVVTCHDHPNARKNGVIFEHVLVMSRHLGRALGPDETVHHKNGIRSDNRIENLQLRAGYHPRGQEPEHLIEHALHILRRYGPLADAAAEDHHLW